MVKRSLVISDKAHAKVTAPVDTVLVNQNFRVASTSYRGPVGVSVPLSTK